MSKVKLHLFGMLLFFTILILPKLLFGQDKFFSGFKQMEVPRSIISMGAIWSNSDAGPIGYGVVESELEVSDSYRNFNSIENKSFKENSNVENAQSYTFVLTHLLGKKLIQKAHLTVGNISVWTLDMKNGSKIKYTITGRVGSDPLCGITAKDNFGEVCAICIEKKSGENVEVEIRYKGGTFTYTGYLLR